MKFRVQSALLHAHLQQVSRVITSKNIVPILESVLFEFEGQTLTLTASDSDTRLSTRLMLDSVEDAPTPFAVKGHLLLDPLKEIPDQLVTFELDQESYKMTGRYANGTFSFMAQDAALYPSVQEFSQEPVELDFAIKDFLEGLRYTLFAASTDESRPVTTGVFVDVKPEDVTFVGTDGFLLSMCRNKEIRTGLETSLILQKKPANLLRNILEKEESDDATIKIKIYGTHAVVSYDTFAMSCRLIEGRYPNYRAVIPQGNTNILTVDRQQLLSALRRVAMFSNQAIGLVVFDLEGERLFLKTNDVDFSTSAEEHLPVSYQGDLRSIAFRAVHIMSVLTNLSSETVEFKLGDKASPGLISPVNESEAVEVTALIMPLMR